MYDTGETGRTTSPSLSKQPKSKMINKSAIFLNKKGINCYLITATWYKLVLNGWLTDPSVGVGVGITEK